MQTDETTTGDMPTTGASRPGPVVGATTSERASTEQESTAGGRPVALRVPTIQVDAPVERAFIVDGLMQDPSGPFAVAWYGQTRRVGIPGNAVFSGHVDYVEVGPAIFARIGELRPGDTIEVVAATGRQYAYAVEWSELFPADAAPVDEILRQTEAEEITLITCGGTFDASVGLYSDRRIVRAQRSG